MTDGPEFAEEYLNIEQLICDLLGASSCELTQEIQSLWSGYGVIRRAVIDQRSAIVKHVNVSKARTNQRGWKSEFSHQRKVRSYQIETRFYREFSPQCGADCRVPKLLGSLVSELDSNWLVVMEDLDASGFPDRKSDLNTGELYACLKWLANFHATFMAVEPNGLWEIGTYWHLATRPDELKAMQDGPLKQAAAAIDTKLNSARFKTLVHGDAKVANFCFSQGGDAKVAAVDFQYVGGGCGMKDVAYLISSCLNEDEAQRRETELLDYYFGQLENALLAKSKQIEFNALQVEWRELYPVCWADFYRFLAGWSPGHWKMNRYSEQLTKEVIDSI